MTAFMKSYKKRPVSGAKRRPGGGGRKPFRKMAPRKRPCELCVKKVKNIDYKDAGNLRRYMTERGKILPRMLTNICARHQRILARAIKRARYIALLPYLEK